jgi:hypothetical protein
MKQVKSVKPVKPSEARKSPNFQKWELEAKEAYDKFVEAMGKITHHFPLKEGYWDMRASGKVGVVYPYEFEVVD